ncbi:MAG: hypothetical protein Q8781_00850 [Candidatus Phytoplasma stylosanthis]|uniref:hypothetical protein n=1 Tax=Candidatus Phytoplasma stylosanthis TaxID=2798314 RepID=UPI00293A056A|nr:hypothetical protein [Candidatus Phytoplasma stylosanthis]MDV3170837.1 hypothetical protein [Candidatus Phytoplasma stylosanthis]MDV3174405.1 hypothetical protein [Candidatus Phytoplasma stylosanthis]MDV3202559.1 hypothetical protein [Candidatus Phytoplasma stylosanthis]
MSNFTLGFILGSAFNLIVIMLARTYLFPPFYEEKEKLKEKKDVPIETKKVKDLSLRIQNLNVQPPQKEEKKRNDTFSLEEKELTNENEI